MIKEYDQMERIKAYAKGIRMSPHKVRKVLNQIRGRSYREALILLEFMPYRACWPVLQTVYSAAANAKHNARLKKSQLWIVEARVDEGPKLKRFRPRARGRGFPIQKLTCNITIQVQSL
uniref:Large ribosomal subunit protein uL22c n=1 Tax=Entransia fimbriata TaxID=130991 RepID=A0A191T4T3_9VIRI|nr:ribosomal protein L22 [Entransia fimbriata]ANI25400.1 ribosomal protein L22 [Entransia fimbriata]WKT05786.1 ribosomal protein L22 [Entransia fimbriata]WKT05905.1 ribosomal protein L22 [Entransia fimbriata]